MGNKCFKSVEVVALEDIEKYLLPLILNELKFKILPIMINQLQMTEDTLNKTDISENKI